jgi:beta-galactosidase/beta-glucuronidase
MVQNRIDRPIHLPGTTDENQKGGKNTDASQTNHLSRVFPYSGQAWYQRDANIPDSWARKRITLLLERTKRTRIWVDDRAVGEQDALAAMQVRDVTAFMAPGRHQLTILVDNARNPPAGGHQLSDDTQTNWNGIIGRIELQATEKVWIDGVQVYPDVAAHAAKLRITIGNLAAGKASGTLRLAAASWNSPRRAAAPCSLVRFGPAANGAVVEAVYDMGKDALPWDEFSPALYKLTVSMKARAGAERFTGTAAAAFGMREFTTRGTQFAINGNTVFLRGKHDACVFPLTGHPPMDVERWMRVFETARDYGINHYRFHSWCPPDAAFAAADRVGIYLQPELFNFGGDFSRDAASAAYTRAEGLRILKDFGNHPSFVMFALGNEMGGGRDVRSDIVREFRRADPRHLYAQASNYEFWEPKAAAGDDYWTTFRTRKGAAGAVRGSYARLKLCSRSRTSS